MRVRARIVRVQYVEIDRDVPSMAEALDLFRREVHGPTFEDDQQYNWETARLRIQDAWAIDDSPAAESVASRNVLD